jgi:hypothetical protein
VGMKKKKFFSRAAIVVLGCLAIGLLASCAYVFKGYQLYPLGVSARTGSAKSIYIQPAIDKRANNVKATMFYGPEKPTKYIVRFEQRAFFVEDPTVQTVPEFFTGAMQNDFRDAGFRIANSRASADYVLITQINKLEGYKEMPFINWIIGVFTFGILMKYDIVTTCDFNAYLMDARTNKAVVTKHYKSEEKLDEYLLDVYSYHTDYYLTKQIKLSIKQLLNDTIRMVR